MSEPTGPRKVIFVGGAPRSGTSVTHALLCTAPGCNEYHSEISFVRPLFESYTVGMKHWQGHTASFFQIPEHLRVHVGKLVQQSMFYIWRVLKKPTIMCVKDPLLTPNFPSVKVVMDWPTQFVTVLRHPHDVVRSQQEVYARSKTEMSALEVYEIARDYMKSYEHLDDPELEGLVFHFRYEDLGKPWLTEQLRSFTGMGGIDPSQLWNEGSHKVTEAEKADPFYSPKYHGPIDTTRRLDPLDPEFAAIVNQVCGPLMAKCGYHPDGSIEEW